MSNRTIIEATKEYTKLSGTEEEILASVSNMLHHIKNNIDEEKIRFAIDLGLCDKDERAEVLTNAIEDKLKNALRELIDDLELDDEEEPKKERKDIDKLLKKLRKKGR